MDSKAFTKLGLTDSESVIYSALLRKGICTVKDIAKESGLHRTNIYDILEQLKEKGLVTFFKEGKTTKYQASDPNNLYEFIREKNEFLDSIFGEIQKLRSQSSELVQVEVYKGAEGMKAAFRDIIRQKQIFYAFGVKGQLREKLPIFGEQFVRDLKLNKIKYYGIYTERNPPAYYTEIRYVSKELNSPVATFIYGDTININIWEPSMVAIIIRSKLVAQMYKKHWDLLWKIAKE